MNFYFPKIIQKTYNSYVKKEISFKNWKIERGQNGFFYDIYYKNKLIIDEICFFNRENSNDSEVQKIIKNNFLRKLPLDFKKVKDIADFEYSFSKKYLFKKSLKFNYFTGDINLIQSIEIQEDFILLSLKFKTKQDYYNDVCPIIKLNDNTASIYKIDKKKKNLTKSKISSLKISNLSKNMPLLINYFVNGEEFNFILKTSFPRIEINKKSLRFSPNSQGTSKNILRSWKMRARVGYTISFLIQPNIIKGKPIVK